MEKTEKTKARTAGRKSSDENFKLLKTSKLLKSSKLLKRVNSKKQSFDFKKILDNFEREENSLDQEELFDIESAFIKALRELDTANYNIILLNRKQSSGEELKADREKMKTEKETYLKLVGRYEFIFNLMQEYSPGRFAFLNPINLF